LQITLFTREYIKDLLRSCEIDVGKSLIYLLKEIELAKLNDKTDLTGACPI